MAASTSSTAWLRFVALLLLSSCAPSLQNGLLSTYWGQVGQESSLQTYCLTGDYDIVMIGFLNVFGQGQQIAVNVGSHCDPSSGGCQVLSQDISSCQSSGIKILLSIGGSAGNYGLDSTSDAEQVAESIWDQYLGGSATSRPFGSAVLDGVDFDLENPGMPGSYYGDLASALRSLMDSNSNSAPSGRFYLGAAPQCPIPDEFLGPGSGTALGTGAFDWVWIQFYNNPNCQYDNVTPSAEKLLNQWVLWTSSLPSNAEAFIGLPASPSAASGTSDLSRGFIPTDVFLNEVLPQLKDSSNYGGLMLWSAYYDQNNTPSPYSSQVRSSL